MSIKATYLTVSFALPENLRTTGGAMLLTLYSDANRIMFAHDDETLLTVERKTLEQELTRRLGSLDANPGDTYFRDYTLLVGTEFEPDEQYSSYAALTHQELLHKLVQEDWKSLNASTTVEQQNAVYVAQALREELLWRLEGNVKEHYHDRKGQ